MSFPAIMVALAATAMTAGATSARMKVQYLGGDAGFACGTGFYAAGTDELVFGYEEPGSHARVRVDGRTHDLVRLTAHTDRHGRIHESWADDEIRVDVVYRETGDYEDGVSYAGAMAVSDGTRIVRLRLTGYQGC